jgi:secreted Zn-dependent insulinase-like peptidase
MSKTYDEKIAEAKEKISQYENQLKAIKQKQKSEERKARTKRLIERGAILESLIENADNLTNDQIKLFLEKTITNDYGRRTLATLTTQSGEIPADTPPKLTTPSNVTTAEKPAVAAHSGGIPQGVDEGNGAGVTG